MSLHTTFWAPCLTLLTLGVLELMLLCLILQVLSWRPVSLTGLPTTEENVKVLGAVTTAFMVRGMKKRYLGGRCLQIKSMSTGLSQRQRQLKMCKL